MTANLFTNYSRNSFFWLLIYELLTRDIIGVIFNVVGGFTMTQWAIGKHRRYKKMFDGKEGRKQYPKGRKAIIPFLL